MTNVITTISNDLAGIPAEFLNFMAKLASGAEIVAEDLETAATAVGNFLNTIATGLQTIETWVADVLPGLEASGLSTSDATAINTALTAAQAIVAELGAVPTTLNTAASVASAISSTISAATATNNVVAAVASTQASTTAASSSTTTAS